MGGCWCGGGVGGVDISSFLCFKMSPPLLNWCSFLSTKTMKRMMMMMMIIIDDDFWWWWWRWWRWWWWWCWTWLWMCVVIYRMAASALLQFHKLAFFCTLFVMARTHSATWLMFHMLHVNFSAAHNFLWHARCALQVVLRPRCYFNNIMILCCAVVSTSSISTNASFLVVVEMVVDD